MDFWNGHMDYHLGFVLTFKCIFCYDLISIFLIGIQYVIHDGGKKNWIEKNNNKTFNEQKTFFWMTKFGPNYQKPNIGHFLLDWFFFPLKMYNKEFSKWVTFHMDVINWLITSSGPLNIGLNIFFSILVLIFPFIWTFETGILGTFEWLYLASTPIEIFIKLKKLVVAWCLEISC